MPHLVDGGLSILQYADDTILFMEHDLDLPRNLKLLLSAFEQMWGLKINFYKSELFCFGEATEAATVVFTQHGWQHNLRIGLSSLAT